MFNILRRRSSQTSSQTILERGIDRMVSERNHHLAMMNQLEKIINDAQTAYNQHTRLYEALNNSLFAINHPFDPIGEELAEALADTDFDADLSVDQPSDGERLDAENLTVQSYLAAAAPHVTPYIPDSVLPEHMRSPLAPTPQELADAEPLNTKPIPFRGRRTRKATAAEAAE